MTPIDFDGRFSRWLRGFLEENQDSFTDISQVEQLMPQLYERFVTTPADWLDGLAPEHYFDGQSPEALVAWISRYELEEVPVPELLLDTIAREGIRARDTLIALMSDPMAPLPSRKM
ncbi:MAG: hypothetical protein PHP02_05930, partial [Eubacteriales bacterium]|nr:hypothetical protein [Eubacteriales bacterium]